MTRSRLGGFTLIEVMVALIIFAVASVSLMASITSSVDAQIRLEQTTLANWVAENAYNEMLVAEEFPATGESNRNLKMAGLEWRVHRKVVATSEATIRRVELTVYLTLGDSLKERAAASLVTFVGQT